jgi:hypothetical protein
MDTMTAVTDPMRSTAVSGKSELFLFLAITFSGLGWGIFPLDLSFELFGFLLRKSL